MSQVIDAAERALKSGSGAGRVLQLYLIPAMRSMLRGLDGGPPSADVDELRDEDTRGALGAVAEEILLQALRGAEAGLRVKGLASLVGLDEADVADMVSSLQERDLVSVSRGGWISYGPADGGEDAN